jgi:KDO2-lipid IV(A) lauroyltransferase
MSIDIQQVINSPLVVNLAFSMGRAIPPVLGNPLCRWIGDWVAARQDSTVTQAVRVNQWVVRGTRLDKETLDQAARETLRNNLRDLYLLYHYVENPEATRRLIHLNPLACDLVKRPEFGQRGLVIAGLHLSGFDLILQSICRQGFKAMILTVPNPQGGRRVEFEMRKRTGMNLVPASLSTLRQAVKHLEQGGIVLTGMDHPVPHSKYRPRFFGHESCLPSHYISLALKAHVPVVIMAAISHVDGTYRILSSEPMEMLHDADRETEILSNTENVLRRAEDFIRLAPEQWNIPMPIWPQFLGHLPQ